MGVVIDTGVFIRWERDGGIIEFSRWRSLGDPCISVISESVPIGARVPTKNPNRFEVDPQPEPDQAT